MPQSKRGVKVPSDDSGVINARVDSFCCGMDTHAGNRTRLGPFRTRVASMPYKWRSSWALRTRPVFTRVPRAERSRLWSLWLIANGFKWFPSAIFASANCQNKFPRNSNQQYGRAGCTRTWVLEVESPTAWPRRAVFEPFAICCRDIPGRRSSLLLTGIYSRFF